MHSSMLSEVRQNCERLISRIKTDQTLAGDFIELTDVKFDCDPKLVLFNSKNVLKT
jgi:hypothetical protein